MTGGGKRNLMLGLIGNCAFNALIDAPVRTGATEEARELFDGLIESRNALGLLSEDIDQATSEPWGNFPQTYSMVGIINGAPRLSRRWDTVL